MIALDKKNQLQKIGRLFGFCFSFFLFSTILFFILNYFNKIPQTWSYFHILGLTLGLIVFSRLLKKILA